MFISPKVWEIRGFGSYNIQPWIMNWKFLWLVLVWQSPSGYTKVLDIFKGYDMVRWFHIPDTSSYRIYAKVSNASDAPTNAGRTPLGLWKRWGNPVEKCGMWIGVLPLRWTIPGVPGQIYEELAVKSKVKLWITFSWFIQSRFEMDICDIRAKQTQKLSVFPCSDFHHLAMWKNLEPRNGLFSCRKLWSPITPLTPWSFEEEAAKNWKAKSPAARQDLFTKPWRLISKGDSHESDLTPGYEIVTPNSQSGVMRKSRVVTATRLTVWS